MTQKVVGRTRRIVTGQEIIGWLVGSLPHK
jgi:hypothetical protein